MERPSLPPFLPSYPGLVPVAVHHSLHVTCCHLPLLEGTLPQRSEGPSLTHSPDSRSLPCMQRCSRDMFAGWTEVPRVQEVSPFQSPLLCPTLAACPLSSTWQMDSAVRLPSLNTLFVRFIPVLEAELIRSFSPPWGSLLYK